MNVRQRTPWLSLAALGIVMIITFGNVAMNVLTTSHYPTAHELQRAEQASLVAARRARIVAIVAEGDRCRAPIARELARLLVLDGRSAVPFADDYARRCGDDPIVRHWADVSVTLAKLHRRG